MGTTPWPPWLEGLSDRDRIRAIVDAVACCYADDRPEDRHGSDGAQHCTAGVAVMLLEQVLVLTRERLAEALTAIEIRPVLLPGRDKGAPAAGAMADAILAELAAAGATPAPERLAGAGAGAGMPEAAGAVSEPPAGLS